MGEQSRETELRQALAMSAAALRSAVDSRQIHPRAKLRFAGPWAHLGSATVSEILDQANAALGTTPANIDSLPEQAGGRT